AVQPVPALRDDVGEKQREQESGEIGPAVDRHERGNDDERERDQRPRQPAAHARRGRAGHVPLRRSRPCGNTIRIASSSTMLSGGAQSEVQKKPVIASATPRKMPASRAPTRFPMPPRMMMVKALTVRPKPSYGLIG